MTDQPTPGTGMWDYFWRGVQIAGGAGEVVGGTVLAAGGSIFTAGVGSPVAIAGGGLIAAHGLDQIYAGYYGVPSLAYRAGNYLGGPWGGLIADIGPGIGGLAKGALKSARSLGEVFQRFRNAGQLGDLLDTARDANRLSELLQSGQLSADEIAELVRNGEVTVEELRAAGIEVPSGVKVSDAPGGAGDGGPPGDSPPSSSGSGSGKGPGKGSPSPGTSRRMTVDEAKEWLESNGHTEFDLDGMDPDSLLLTTLEPGDRIRQFTRAGGGPGDWYGVDGATLDNVTLSSGASGRTLVEFEVAQPITVLESHAAPTFDPRFTDRAGNLIEITTEAGKHQAGYGIGSGGASQFLFPKLPNGQHHPLRPIGPAQP